MFEDKTKDLDDPGMFALNRLTEAFQGTWQQNAPI